jgi:hypothetical protein
MKTTFVILIVLCAGAAFGQTAALISNQQSIISIPDHPQQAQQHAMAIEHPLVGGSDTYSYAKGERPLWEFGPVSEPVPLGDVARANRREKLAAKKAQIVLEKQGSQVR